MGRPKTHQARTIDLPRSTPAPRPRAEEDTVARGGTSLSRCVLTPASQASGMSWAFVLDLDPGQPATRQLPQPRTSESGRPYS